MREEHVARNDGAARELDRAVRDHLVRVHVRGRTRAALDDVHHELAVQVAGADFLRGCDDRVRDVAIEQAELVVGHCRRFLDRRECLHEERVLRDGDAGDREVLDRAQRLHAVVGRGWYIAFAEQVVLATYVA